MDTMKSRLDLLRDLPGWNDKNIPKLGVCENTIYYRKPCYFVNNNRCSCNTQGFFDVGKSQYEYGYL